MELDLYFLSAIYYIFFFLQVSGSLQGDVSCRVSPVLSPLSHDFRTKAKEEFVSSLQTDVRFISMLAHFLQAFCLLLSLFSLQCHLILYKLFVFVGNRWYHQHW